MKRRERRRRNETKTGCVVQRSQRPDTRCEPNKICSANRISAQGNLQRTEQIQALCTRIDPNRDATLLDKKATITATVYHHRTSVVLEYINPRFAGMFLANLHPLVAMT